MNGANLRYMYAKSRETPQDGRPHGGVAATTVINHPAVPSYPPSEQQPLPGVLGTSPDFA